MASPNGHDTELVDGQLEEASTSPSSVAPPETSAEPEFSSGTEQSEQARDATDNVTPPENFPPEFSGDS